MDSSKTTQTRKRTRLSPDDRRTQLLDSTRKIIRDQGISSLTMEAVATEAGVSNPLIYKYFDTRLSLLQELLVREFENFERELSDRLAAADSYDTIVEVFVRTDFEQAERNNMLRILIDQPDIYSAIADAEKKSRRNVAKLLMAGLADIHPVSPRKAARILTMASSASKAAGENFRRFGGRKNKMILETKAFILAAINAAARWDK